MPNLETFVKAQFAKFLEKDCPHLKRPTAVLARVTSAASAGSDSWVYTIKLLDEGQSPEKYPEIPGVKSKLQIEQGKLAAVVLLYGNAPFIVGEVPE